jgi:hypothetical protein
MSVTSGAETDNPSGTPEFIPSFMWGTVRVVPSLVFCAMHIALQINVCSFFLFPLDIELSVLLQFTINQSNYFNGNSGYA